MNNKTIKKNVDNKRNKTIDIIRIIACFMVIICHVQLPSELSRYSKALARFAVPYFMMVTGWYIWRKDNEEAINVAKKSLVKFLIFTLKAIFFISIINSIICIINNESAFEWFTLFNDTRIFVLFLLFNRAAFFSSIMWYLLAMIYVLVIYIIFLKHNILKKAYNLIIPLIVMNLVVGELFNMEWYYSGNWLLTGLPFVLLGSYLKSINWLEKENIHSILFIIIGIIISLIEARYYNDKILYGGSLLIVIGIFSFAIKHPNNSINPKIAYFGGKCTSIIFVIHCSIKNFIYTIFRVPNTTIVQLSMPFFLFIISSIISIIVVYIKEQKPLNYYFKNIEENKNNQK